jgi:hypothetical protein
MWDEIMPGDFACKPDILVPQRFVFGSPGVNVTLSCLVTGSPAPQVPAFYQILRNLIVVVEVSYFEMS